ncbi:acyl carrier protein [Streptomyces sp. NPDC006514]|uniref:acyl carrier protein n=1 Tax=Streptomyces sp. NPDC006514 TaxID=3154308 RepID=UPI0033A4DC75
MSTVEQRVQKIVAETLGIKEEEVTPEKSFIGDLGADETDFFKILDDLEEEFEADLPDEEREKITTVQAAISRFSRQRA